MRLQSLTVTGLVGSVLLLGACASTMDQVSTNIAPKAEQSANGQFNAYQFSTPDDGTRLKIGSGVQLNYSMHAMLEPLKPNERKYMAQVIFALAGYKGCTERGYTTYVASITPLNKRRSPQQCDMGGIYRDSASIRSTYLTKGRTDRLKKRRVTSLGTGVRDKGWSDVQSWNYFVSWGGGALKGKTRTELVEEFLEGTNGAYYRPPFF